MFYPTEETNDIKTKPTAMPTLPGDDSFDPCANTDCPAAEKPILESMITVNVVFGIKGIDRSKVVRNHVMQGKVILL